MALREVKEVLDAEVIVGEDQLETEITNGANADLMSDALAFAKSASVLLTGLTNTHVVRTCHVLDIAAVIMVHGKRPLPDAVQLARELRMPILLTDYILYQAAGRLCDHGIPGCTQKVGRG